MSRQRAAFPAARTLVLMGSHYAPPLRDANVAPVAAWGLTGVQLHGWSRLTRVGLGALCGPALTALCLWDTHQLSGADVAAVTARLPRLRTLRLSCAGPLTDADLAAWGGVQSLAVSTLDAPGFSWDGVRHLTAARELVLPLPPQTVAWAGDALRGLTHLARLSLASTVGVQAAVAGHAGLVAPGSLPRSLRHVTLRGLALQWPPGVEPDGGATLLRPLAGVADVALVRCAGVGDAGLRVLVGASRLDVDSCDDAAGEHLEALGRALEVLTVSGCDAFTGGGLGSLSVLRRLTVGGCRAFRADALATVAASCRALERVDVWWHRGDTPAWDVATAEAALVAAAGGGSGAWAFTRENCAWAATRR
jgi:hypothetical protein